MNVTTYKIVAGMVRVPEKFTEKTEYLTVGCKAADCPLLAAGKCLHFEYARRSFGGKPCVHGKAIRVDGFTRKAKGWSQQKDQWKSEVAAIRNGLGSAEPFLPESMIEIDGWVMLPYAHMNYVEDVPWIRREGWFDRGVPWMKREDFTPQVVIKLVNAHLTALMGGEIKDYAAKSVPRFLYDLWVMFPDLYAAAFDIEPRIDRYMAGRDFFQTHQVPVSLLTLPQRITKLDGTDVNGVLMRDEIGQLVLTVEGGADVRLQGVYGAIDTTRPVRAMFPIKEGRWAAPESSATRQALWDHGAYCRTLPYRSQRNETKEQD